MAEQPTGFQFDAAGEMTKEWECSICLMIIRDVVDLPCNHIYCEQCLEYHEDKVCPREERDETFVPNFFLFTFFENFECQSHF